MSIPKNSSAIIDFFSNESYVTIYRDLFSDAVFFNIKWK